jgi:DNA-binding NtrC family response regulator/tetratricopeptide (TPR) repeat protein
VARKRPDINPEHGVSRESGGSTSASAARAAALSALDMGRVYLESYGYSDAIESLSLVARGESLATLKSWEVAELYANLARSHVGLGQYDEARGWLDKLEDLDVDDGRRAEARVILAKIESRSGRFREALAASQKAYAVLSTRPDSPLLVEASKMMGTAHAELGNVSAARDCFLDCLVTNRRLGDEAGIAGSYNNLGILAKRSGDLDAAVEYFEAALKVDRRLGRLESVAGRLTNLGVALYRLSRWTEAEGHLRKALEIYSGLGAARGVVSAELALGNVHRARREWDKARARFGKALETSSRAGYRRSEALALEFIGDLQSDEGHHEEALETLDHALACGYQLSASSDVVGEVLRRRAEVLLCLGRLDEAEADCRRSLELCGRLGDRLEEGAALRVLAAITYAGGDPGSARARIRRAEDLLRRTGESFELARTSLTAGIGLAESSPVDGFPLERIEARFFAAEEMFERIGSTYWVARCRLERARALFKARQYARSRSWLERAAESFAASGEPHGRADVSSLLRALDRELAGAVAAPHSRYSVIADGYRALDGPFVDAETLHGLASRVAERAEADRLVLFDSSNGDGPGIATSFDRTGRRLAEVRRIVRAVGNDAGPRKTMILSGAGVPEGVASVALVPVALGSRAYLLYIDRSSGEDRRAFNAGDIEFIGAASRMLGMLHAAVDPVGPARAAVEEPESGAVEFLTRDPRLLEILANVERLRDSDIPILILGESGTGKDVLARTIHQGGRRSRFVALNSGAIPPHLQESELFGHVKGAFTDADRDRGGLIAAADGGTLFLDEIGEMSRELQVKLLRFLQSGEYRRVGDSEVRTGDARVISASNRDLRQEVLAGRFRRDLFYRLSAFIVEVPPLRERPQDVPLLMEHFLKLYCAYEGKSVSGFSRSVRELFLSYDWRGNNVRELENEVRRGVALCGDGGVIDIDELRPELRARREAILSSGQRLGSGFLSLRDEVEALERSRIAEALEFCGKSKPKAADYLGLSRTGLYTKIRKYHME